MSEQIIPKKRGRKPKQLKKEEIEPTKEEVINSENENIILHLPITMKDIATTEVKDNDWFIRSESELVKPIKKQLNLKKDKTESSSEEISTIESIISEPQEKVNLNVLKIITHNMNFKANTKCWWCRNSFETVPVQLPEEYFSGIFHCIGHFCSYNCAKAYNLDLNDSLVWKRESLINLLYVQTYSEDKEITTAPSWMVLDDYGGTLTIEQFRKNFTNNTTNYLVLRPPLISRQMQIEESYKPSKSKNVPINGLNKLFTDTENDFVLKRSKPIQTSHLSLASTMGLIKTKN